MDAHRRPHPPSRRRTVCACIENWITRASALRNTARHFAGTEHTAEPMR
jgi:hypothetical protein